MKLIWGWWKGSEEILQMDIEMCLVGSYNVGRMHIEHDLALLMDSRSIPDTDWILLVKRLYLKDEVALWTSKVSHFTIQLSIFTALTLIMSIFNCPFSIVHFQLSIFNFHYSTLHFQGVQMTISDIWSMPNRRDSARKGLFLPRGHLGPGHLLLLHAVSRCLCRKSPTQFLLLEIPIQRWSAKKKSEAINGIDHD